jgi:hypothetical protein
MMNTAGAPFHAANMVIPNAQTNPYDGGIPSLIPHPNTASWYKTQYGCLKNDPTMISRLHTFPDAVIPRGIPKDPAAPAKICLDYRTAWAMEEVNAAGMVDTEQDHPQFAFRAGGPGTPYQIDVESTLRRLDQPLGKCQAVIAEDAPLYRNTVAPPVPTGVRADVQNAANPIAAIIRPGEDECRRAADTMAVSMSSRFFNNPTRQDTMRFDKPFSPPGIGVGAPRNAVAADPKKPYYA